MIFLPTTNGINWIGRILIFHKWRMKKRRWIEGHGERIYRWREETCKDRWRAVVGRGFGWMKPLRKNLLSSCTRDKEPSSSSSSTTTTLRIPEGKFTLIKTVPVTVGGLFMHASRTEFVWLTLKTRRMCSAMHAWEYSSERDGTIRKFVLFYRWYFRNFH